MDMENTRRSFDRSREPGSKKPRLIDELDRGSNPTTRPFPQPRKPPPSAVEKLPPAAVATARFRINSDRNVESIDLGQGGYHPEPLTPHQELVNQYKTALAELTFNSKPIITNLTIIAGENLSAAKAIAGTVCANILEVPSEQKLPSLYLLDSIVKNIARDYIKHFAAKLPEVFCKAYRQVDPPVHSSMRHLFGTWKGVFPPQTLQMIEKELGFTPAVNGSASASSTLRSDSQSQRPPHSIHVNPKYLERQRLQQSSRTKGVDDDITGANLNSNEDPERLNRVLGASRPWLDPRINMLNNQRTKRDSFIDSVPEKSVAGSYGGIEYSSDISSKADSGIGRTGSRVTVLGQDKAWYKAGGGVAETVSGQKNGFSFKHGFSNPEALKSMNLDAHRQSKQNLTNISSSLASSNWKNSEEEEFMWDEMNSGMTADGASNVPDNLNLEPWTADDENLEGGDHLQTTRPFVANVGREMSTVKKQPAFGEHSLLPWKLQEQQSIDKLNLKPGPSKVVTSSLGGLPGNTNALAVRMGNQSFMPNVTIGIDDIMGQQQFDSVGAESTSGQLPLGQRSPSLPVSVSHPHPMRNLGALQSQQSQDRSPALPPNVQVSNMRRSREKDLQGPLSSVTSSQPRQQQQLGSLQTEVNDKTKKPPHSKVSLASETSEQSATSSLPAAAVKSAILSKSITSSIPSTSSLGTKNLPSELGVRAARSARPSPTTLVSSVSAVASPPSIAPRNDGSSALPKIPQAKAGQRPRVSAQQSASSNMRSPSPTTSKATNNNSLAPISNLLSSLVAKGLISAETESQTKVPMETLVQLEDQAESITASSSLAVASVSSSAAVPVPSSRGEAGGAKTSIALTQSASTEIRNIIGFDFKPNIIRELHPTVISGLSDDLPHHCGVCGIRLKQQEQLDRHLEWHDTREREQNGLIRASRKWYARPDDWISGKTDYQSELTDFVDLDDEKTDISELDTMVVADENQCLCVLCGELFEDVYSQEKDEWMFKGAVYFNFSDSNTEMERKNFGAIVHAKCLSENSTSGVSKMEQD